MAKPLCIHMISDSTGQTVAMALRACTAMFKDVHVLQRRHVMIRSMESLDRALEAVAAEPGLVFHTVIEAPLRSRLEARCHEIGVPAIPFLDPMMSALTAYLGKKAELKTGAQHAVDENYYRRVAALEYAVAADDGTRETRLQEAEVVLLGVSRTSKTPTCAYLAGRGVKAANVPLIPGRSLPDGLRSLDRARTLLVGLTARPRRLAEIRQNRLTAMNHTRQDTDYADLERIRAEVREAQMTMSELGCHMIDVTRRSIEETAAEIIGILEDQGMSRS